ncbi:uncharacterized protein UHOD_11981 [Ustilago sp. UG-2017b]|nr:uncharacterized protein UHOD_11981 [Ustilago sp. UG-2017b]
MSTGDSAVRCIHVKGGGGRRFFLLVAEGMLEARVVSSSNSKRGCVSEDERTENSKEDVPVFSVPVGFLYRGKQEVYSPRRLARPFYRACSKGGRRKNTK